MLNNFSMSKKDIERVFEDTISSIEEVNEFPIRNITKLNPENPDDVTDSGFSWEDFDEMLNRWKYDYDVYFYYHAKFCITIGKSKVPVISVIGREVNVQQLKYLRMYIIDGIDSVYTQLTKDVIESLYIFNYVEDVCEDYVDSIPGHIDAMLAGSYIDNFNTQFNGFGEVTEDLVKSIMQIKKLVKGDINLEKYLTFGISYIDLTWRLQHLFSIGKDIIIYSTEENTKRERKISFSREDRSNLDELIEFLTTICQDWAIARIDSIDHGLLKIDNFPDLLEMIMLDL